MSTATRRRNSGFTDEQHRAVTTRGVSVSLSAGAGCGKTFVLTERYLDYFDPRDSGALAPEEIGQLVAITFTERAAREMRDRIRAKCYDRLRQAADEDAAYWAELLRALDRARISTIHSFCAALLRARAVEAGIDPQFTVLEPAQAETLLSEAVDDEIRRRVSQGHETTLDLAVRFQLSELREMVRLLVLQATPEDFDTWRAVSPDEQVARWSACARSMTRELGRGLAVAEPARTVRDLLRATVPDDPVMRERRRAVLAALERLEIGPASPDELAPCLDALEANARVDRSRRAAAWPSQEVYEAFRDEATILRKAAAKLRGLAEFDPQAARQAAVAGGQLLAIADGACRAFARRKDELRAMDFDDLLVRARRLLTDDAHRPMVGGLAAGMTLLLVDEFQDTDPVQVELVEALAGEHTGGGKLFFVGDYKQSIYRFRGADPHVFHQLRAQTPEAGQQTLSLNFRSQPAILEFVNALFWDDLGSDYEPLRPHRPQVSPRPAVEFLWAPADRDGPGETADKETADELRGREADWIARRVRAVLDGGEPIVWDEEAARRGQPAGRPAKQGDIAILLRALTNVEAYEAALRRYGIDYYLVGGHAFYAQQEIFDLVNLLRALDNPSDAVSLIGALRSGFFSLADETIFWLSQHPRGIAAGLFAESYPGEIDPREQDRAAFAARVLRQLRASKDRMRICELIDEALALTGYDAALLAEFLGDRKLANLVKLQEQARAFQRGDFLDLADFIAQLAHFVARQPEEPLAATHSEETDVVRLMSVHQAKGLEFPIVVVPDVNRQPRGPTASARFDSRLGPLVRLPREENPAASGYDLWRQLEKAEEAAETNRLLYVATTRAADYLLLSAGVGAVGEATGPWAKLLARRFDLASGRFHGRLPAGEPIPHVRVTAGEPPRPRGHARRRARVDVDQMIAGVERTAAETAPPNARAVHPVAPQLGRRREFSFSRLAGTLHRKFERLDEGEFIVPASHDPRGLGTLVHAALAAIDGTAPGDCRALVERLAEQHLPQRTAEVYEAVEMVERFATSPRARAMAAARRSHAEIEFLLAWPPGTENSSSVLLRGFIDRLYQDTGGAWHLVDFKTNRLTGANVAAQVASYEMQLLLYGLAAQRVLGSPPASLVVHFLRTGAEHLFAWNDDARRRVIKLVNDAIAGTEG